MTHPPKVLEAQAAERKAVDARIEAGQPEPNSIMRFLHCRECIEEWTTRHTGGSPRDYLRVEVGWTLLGLQVWCIRHERNVLLIDLEGAQHPAH